MRKYFIIFLILPIFFFAPRAHASVNSYSRTPSGSTVTLGTPVVFNYDVITPPGTVTYTLVFHSSLSGLNSGACYPAMAHVVGSDTFSSFTVGETVDSIQIKYFAFAGCPLMAPLGADMLELGVPVVTPVAFTIVAPITSGSCTGTVDYCFMYYYFTGFTFKTILLVVFYLGFALFAFRLIKTSFL